MIICFVLPFVTFVIVCLSFRPPRRRRRGGEGGAARHWTELEPGIFIQDRRLLTMYYIGQGLFITGSVILAIVSFFALMSIIIG